MPQYTTGEMAKLTGVTVRTVQFYDAKGLLPPSELSEGGRRLYSEDDLEKLKLICLLRSMGLSLDPICGILTSEHPDKVLILLLSEQEKRIAEEIREKQEQRRAVEEAMKSLSAGAAFPVNSIGGMAEIMKRNGKLKKAKVLMLTLGILMDLVQIGTVLLWVLRGVWWPFAVGMPFVIAAGVWLSVLYYRASAYICPECGRKFKPSGKEAFFALHTPRTRKLTCPDCGKKRWCVETDAED